MRVRLSGLMGLAQHKVQPGCDGTHGEPGQSHLVSSWLVQSCTAPGINRQANALAQHLINLGVRPDDRVAVVADQQWLRTASQMEGALIPGLTIKAFDSIREAEAEAWLLRLRQSSPPRPRRSSALPGRS